jgi:hypothetical protein
MLSGEASLNAATQKIVFTQLYPIGKVPVTQDAAGAPGVNTKVPFPFGKKDDAFKLEAVQKKLSDFTIISQANPTDNENIVRYKFPKTTLSAMLGDTERILSKYIPAFKNKKIEAELRLLVLTKSYGPLVLPSGIVGLEFSFSQATRTLLDEISRVVLFFMKDTTQKNADEIPDFMKFAGIKFVSLNVANPALEGMIILNQTVEQKTEARELITTALTNLKRKGGITAAVLSKLDATIKAVGTSTVGLMIEKRNDLVTSLNTIDKQYGLSHINFNAGTALFWNKSNKNADFIVHLIQQHKMPIPQNYYLLGTILHYSEADIKLRYQIEGYLRAHNKMCADGSVAWPYNIPKWGIENGKAFNEWVEKKWNAKLYLLSSDKYKRKQYEKDKKDAQKYIALLPAGYAPTVEPLAKAAHVVKKPVPVTTAKPTINQKSVSISTNNAVKPKEEPIVPIDTQKLEKDYKHILTVADTFYNEFETKKFTLDDFKKSLEKKIYHRQLIAPAIKYIMNPILLIARLLPGDIYPAGMQDAYKRTIRNFLSDSDMALFLAPFTLKSKKYESDEKKVIELMKANQQGTVTEALQNDAKAAFAEIRNFFVKYTVKNGMILVKRTVEAK